MATKGVYSHPMDRVFLKNREEDRILLGHPWVFDNEIERYQGPCESGSTVEVLTKSGHFLGKGVLNRASKITVRLFTRDREEEVDRDFFLRRFRSALDSRKSFYQDRDSYRLVFAESDLVPGLIVDRFASTDGKVYLSAQFLTLGVDRWRDEIASALAEATGAAGIFERSDVPVRRLEGLEERKGFLTGDFDPRIVILENGVELEVDLEKGQKTGYFLDQKDNRQRVASVCSGIVGENGDRCRVLDTFTHTGAFGLNAWKGGASEIESVDVSEEAVATVKANALRNGADRVRAVQADVFDLLKDYEKQGRKFDLIVLDPPAFTKSAKMIEKAYGGYKEINLRALRLLERGGYLVTCSCSHFFGADRFYSMLQNAARDSRKTLQILEKRGPGPDHPSLSGYPESDYLKCAVCRSW